MSSETPRNPTPRKNFPEHVRALYDIEQLLGEGAFSRVWRCRHRATGQVRALKQIDTSDKRMATSNFGPREIAHEVALMRLLRHECVVRCYEVFLEAQYVNIVVDMLAGGDLVDGLNAHRSSRGRLPDRQLARLTAQMFAAVVHVHHLQIVHRDIKGENFLSDRSDIGDPACRLALSDFGSARRVQPGEMITTQVGTPAFWAPEVWACSYSFGNDVWATGTTTFLLLSGTLPFDGEAQICGPAPAKVPYYASRECAEFLALCLTKDASQRPSAAEASRHAWLRAADRPEPPRSLVAEAAPSAEMLSRTAGWAAEALVDALGAVAMGCCSAFGLCLDIILSGGEVSEAGQRKRASSIAAQQSPRAAARDSLNAAPVPPPRPPTPPADVEVEAEYEKEFSVLTERISSIHTAQSTMETAPAAFQFQFQMPSPPGR